MEKHMLLEVTPILGVGVIYEADTKTIEQLIIENPMKKQMLDRIYCGRVSRVADSLGGAFVDIGDSQHAFISKKSLQRLSKEPVRAGQSIVAQVNKEPYQYKGAGLSDNIAISGAYGVYLPYASSVLLSKKLSREMMDVFEPLLTPLLDGKGGAIVRSAAASVSETPEVLVEEMKGLMAKWDVIYREGMLSPKPKCLYTPGDFYETLLGAARDREVSTIYIASLEQKAQLLEAGFEKASIKVSRPKNALWIEKNVDIETLLTKRVFKALSGVSVTIEETEAFTCIDVNSAQRLSGESKLKAALSINREAAQLIADGLMAQNIAGAILIDFLEMSPEDQTHFYRELCHTYFTRARGFMPLGFTKLGLLEMTRKRETPSFRDLLSFNFFEKDLNFWHLNSLYFDLLRLRHHTRTRAVKVSLDTEMYRFVSQHHPFESIDLEIRFEHQQASRKAYQIHT